jgi:hypothetical protein
MPITGEWNLRLKKACCIYQRGQVKMKECMTHTFLLRGFKFKIFTALFILFALCPYVTLFAQVAWNEGSDILLLKFAGHCTDLLALPSVTLLKAFGITVQRWELFFLLVVINGAIWAFAIERLITLVRDLKSSSRAG